MHGAVEGSRPSIGGQQLVVRNTFLELFDEHPVAVFEGGGRARTVSDVTDSRLPHTVEYQHKATASEEAYVSSVAAMNPGWKSPGLHCLKSPALSPGMGPLLTVSEELTPLHVDVGLGAHPLWNHSHEVHPQLPWNALPAGPSMMVMNGMPGLGAFSGYHPSSPSAPVYPSMSSTLPGLPRHSFPANAAPSLVPSTYSTMRTKRQQASADVGSDHPRGQPTTVMLRNIPNRYTQSLLVQLLDESNFRSLYDFVYLPMDFRNGVNLGYAFVNFLAHSDALRATHMFHGFSRWSYESSKVCEVSWAHPHQGLEEHIERYRNSPVMHQCMPDEYKPMLFKNSVRVPFPPPTKAIKAPKLRPVKDRPPGEV